MSNTNSKVHDQLVAFGITPQSIHRNLPVEKLVEQSIETNEGMLTSTGSLSVKTGKYTGRSPQDRYIIYDDETHETIDWGDVNSCLLYTSPSPRDGLLSRMTSSA